MKTHLKSKQYHLLLTGIALSLLALHKRNNAQTLLEPQLMDIEANQGESGNKGTDNGMGNSGTGGNQSGRSGNSGDFDDTDGPSNQIGSGSDESEDNNRINNNDPDVVGKMTGRNVDESVLDLTDGGTTANMYSSSDGATTSGQVTTPSEAVDSESENYGAGAVIKSGDIGSSNAGKDPSSPGGKYVEVPRKPTDRIPGTGSGAASNDRGERLHDIDSGTGSAQRGNQAGVDSPDEGTIIDQ